jgi:valyl-tRNA synthetase
MKMNEVDEEAIECVKIAPLGTRNDVYLKSKGSLELIRIMTKQPILKCGTNYTLIDGETAYIYEGK